MKESEVGTNHHNYPDRGRVLHWKGSDKQELFEQNCQDPVKKELLQQLGWLDPDCISYKLNSFGFRDEEFDARPCGIALGCSHTEGIGLPEEFAWPRVLSQLVGIHIWNLGVGGSSIDTTFRLLDHWLPRLNPKFVVLCVPPDSRVEVFDSTDPVSLTPNFYPSDHLLTYYKVWSTGENNARVSKRKNLLAMQQLCDQANTPLRYLDHSALLHSGHARDLMHFGVASHNAFARQMYNLL
jgi:hypothetical protein